MKTFDPERKNRTKVLRVLLQVVIILAIVFVAVKGFLFPAEYRPVQTGFTASGESSDTTPGTSPAGVATPVQVASNGGVAASGQANGFIAIGYLGVEAGDSQSRVVIPRSKVEAHLQALQNSGFVTISQDDILSYYNGSYTLPDGAMFLMFEDGLRDTPSLVQGFLEKHNYQATAWAYTEHFIRQRAEYLQASDLKELEKDSFWELGASGYQLSYINVIDRYGNYFGNLNALEFFRISRYLNRNYDHYLMDYIRDGDEVPMETTQQLASRIEQDFIRQSDGWSAAIGKEPILYSHMHANSGKYGTHEAASVENERWIKEKFKLAFNREGYSYNDRNNGPYDLTRMQPYAEWSVNNLLMRIAIETGRDMAWVTGNVHQAGYFTQLAGKTEFKGDNLILTSDKSGVGLLRLNTLSPGGLQLDANLYGNTSGGQTIYLMSNEDGSRAIAVTMKMNHLVVSSVADGQTIDLLDFDLYDINRSAPISKEQDEHNGLLALQDAIIQLDEDPNRIEQARKRKLELQAVVPLTVKEGGEEYIPAVDQLQRGSRALSIRLAGDKLTIRVDGHVVADNLAVPTTGYSYVLLESRPMVASENTRHVYDPVYDAVFQNLTIKNINGINTLFTNQYSLVEQAINGVKTVWDTINTWFLSNL